MINQLYSPLQKGGAEKSVQILSECLANMGHEVHVVTLNENGRLPGREMINKVHVHRVRLANLYSPHSGTHFSFIKPLWHIMDMHNPFMARRVGRLLREIRPDIVNTHVLAGFSGSVLKTIRKTGFPLVHTLRDYYVLCSKSTQFHHGKICTRPCAICRMLSLFRRRMTGNVDAVVGISDFVLRHHRSQGLFENASAHVVYNPVLAPRTDASALIPGEDGVLRFGYLGRLEPSKGIEVLLKFFPETGSRLYIGGTGDTAYVKSLKERYQSERIVFCGQVNMPVFFKSIDVLVVPSLWHEPFGRIVVEAFSYGVPVLAHRVGGLPELIEEGKNGWLYDDDLAERLRTISIQKRQNPIAYDNDRFSDTAVARQYLSIYRDTQRRFESRRQGREC